MQGSDSRFKVPEREAGLNCKVNFMHLMAGRSPQRRRGHIKGRARYFGFESEKTVVAFKMSVWLLWKMNLRRAKGRNWETNCLFVMSYLTGNSQEPLAQQGGPFAHKGLQNGVSSRFSAEASQSHSVSRKEGWWVQIPMAISGVSSSPVNNETTFSQSLGVVFQGVR